MTGYGKHNQERIKFLGIIEIGVDPLRGAVVWFLLFGFVLFVLGLAINIIEEMSNGDIPASIGFSLLFIILLGVVLMPISGFWFALPPALSIVYYRYKKHRLSNI
jgi:hypothetical protein